MQNLSQKKNYKVLVLPTMYVSKNSKKTIDSVYLLKTVNDLVESFSSSYELLCGKPLLSLKSTSVVNPVTQKVEDKPLLKITIGCYSRVESSMLTTMQMMNFQYVLSTMLNMPVQLEMVKLNSPYLEANLLAHYLSNELKTNTQNFYKVMSRVSGAVSHMDTLSDLFVPSFVTGMKTKLAGRLTSERTRPRFTKQTMEMGYLSFSPNTLNTAGSYTTSNYKGEYTVRVWLGQKF